MSNSDIGCGEGTVRGGNTDEIARNARQAGKADWTVNAPLERCNHSLFEIAIVEQNKSNKRFGD
jgi:hypothetical protein